MSNPLSPAIARAIEDFGFAIYGLRFAIFNPATEDPGDSDGKKYASARRDQFSGVQLAVLNKQQLWSGILIRERRAAAFPSCKKEQQKADQRQQKRHESSHRVNTVQ
jgi:hypothetical protein